jgi:hypothetical protein
MPARTSSDTMGKGLSDGRIVFETVGVKGVEYTI